MQKFWFLKSWKPKFPLENKVKRRRRQPKLYLNLQNNFEKALIWLKLFLRKNLSVFFSGKFSKGVLSAKLRNTIRNIFPRVHFWLTTHSRKIFCIQIFFYNFFSSSYSSKMKNFSTVWWKFRARLSEDRIFLEAIFLLHCFNFDFVRSFCRLQFSGKCSG